MSIEIVINATPEETRVARVENKVATEFYFDRKKERGIAGNVYKGRVVKVLPGMQAAFVEIGTDKAAFLHVDDVMIPRRTEPVDAPEVADEGDDDSPFSEGIDLDESSDLEMASESAVSPGDETGQPEASGEGFVSSSESVEVPGWTDPAVAPVEPSKRPLTAAPRRPAGGARAQKKSATIESLLSEGQEILVQVTKEPIGTKGPRVTTYVSLPGRYLVSLPTVNQVGISRRIPEESERKRLKEMIRRLRKPGTGYIVRTVSHGMTEDDVKQDMAFLEAVWEEIGQKQAQAKAPALLHNDFDLLFRTIRDLFTKEIDRLVIDSKSEYDRIRPYVKTYLADYAARMTLWDKETPLFESYDLEREIAKSRSRRVWLKSGGYLVIDRAEALTVIDVNTGRYTGKKDVEETILKTNLEAADEIAHQLRLRNTGGIIIIDFIDMEKEKNRERVFQTFQEALSTDKAKTKILKISELGLVQMSRERTREDMLRVLCEPCAVCEGIGYTKSPTTVCYEIFREVRQIATSPRYKKVMISVHPAVAELLFDGEQRRIEALEREHQKKIIIHADANFQIEQYELVPV